MDRYAIFVDAGYLYAAAGTLCHGTSSRGALDLSPDKVVYGLRDRCGNHCDLPHLRTYWYDGAPNAVPTEEHLRFGTQQGVKLRLGRLTRRGQKGVDARIVRDLIVLSRNNAIRTAYLMSGDEDVREGVVEAQEFGVSVVLLGIEPPPNQYNQAATLVREADDSIILSRSDCTKFISLRAEEAAGLRLTLRAEIQEGATPSEFGVACGIAVRSQLDAGSVATMLESHPRIPKHIDAWLIKDGGERFGDPLDQPNRHAIRGGFWDGLRQVSEEDGRQGDPSSGAVDAEEPTRFVPKPARGEA